MKTALGIFQLDKLRYESEFNEKILTGLGDFLTEALKRREWSTIIAFESFLNFTSYEEKKNHLDKMFFKKED